MRVKFSFDYELAWGTHEMLPGTYLDSNVRWSNRAALALAELHEEAQVPATWGLVGAALSAEPLDERIEQCRVLGAPIESLLEQLSRYSEREQLEFTTIPDTFVEALQASRFQTAGSHGYGHLYAPSVDFKTLVVDLELSLATLESRGLGKPELLIAPKNLTDSNMRAAAAQVGIPRIRTNPDNWLYRTPEQPRSRAKSIAIQTLRRADSLVPVNELLGSSVSNQQGHPADEVGNFFFRPSLPRTAFKVHLQRFALWLKYCRRKGQNVHVWSHPHNFAPNLDQALANYRELLDLVVADDRNLSMLDTNGQGTS